MHASRFAGLTCAALFLTVMLPADAHAAPSRGGTAGTPRSDPSARTAARAATAASTSVLPAAAAGAADASEARAAAHHVRTQAAERLLSMVFVELDEWRFHEAEGLERGEAKDLDDSGWRIVKVHKDRWTTDDVWVRRSVEVPTRVGGRDLRGMQSPFTHTAVPQSFSR